MFGWIEVATLVLTYFFTRFPSMLIETSLEVLRLPDILHFTGFFVPDSILARSARGNSSFALFPARGTTRPIWIA